jgi:murein DD-endopeptidase MepM/ murein hydrolase activator NlpD
MNTTRHSSSRATTGRTLSPFLIGAMLTVLLGAVFLLVLDRRKPAPLLGEPKPADVANTPAAEAVPALRNMLFPSPQQNLFGPGWEKGIQPTVSGKPESGLYGSSRTGSKGLASFHEGVDIAAVARDAKGNPTDPAAAVADGRVAYANRTAGNSNYGLYVILIHADPAGDIYTLYAHLAAIDPSVTPGATVTRGARLGTVGNTPASIIPRDRAHLHFEIGLLANDRFSQWAKGSGLKDPHGEYNGRNLLGVDPIPALAQSSRDPAFTMLVHLQKLPVAFTVIARSRGRLPDYFRRHPALWTDSASDGKAFALACTEAGVPISGRMATPEETARLGRANGLVASVDETVLGRNGRHLVVRRKQGWELGQNGDAWLDLLMY